MARRWNRWVFEPLLLVHAFWIALAVILATVVYVVVLSVAGEGAALVAVATIVILAVAGVVSGARASCQKPLG